MHELYELKDKLTKELKEYGSKDLSAGSLDVVDKLAHSIKNICKIIESAEDEEYSQRYAYDGGGQSSNRNRYAYARGRGRNARRDSMGRYTSRADGYSQNDGLEELVESVRGMMDELPQGLQQDAQRFVQKLEQQM